MAIGEPHPLLCELVDVWRSIEIAALTRQAHPPQIVDQDENKIEGFFIGPSQRRNG